MKPIMYKTIVMSAVLVGLFAGCTSKDVIAPTLDKQEISKKENQYTYALSNLGNFSTIFESDKLYIQTKGILDDTGVSQRMASRGEVPYDITEMFKSSINDIAGSIRMIDYDPSHQSNMMALGYTKFDKKIKPDLIISGGITEFDKSLSVSKTGVNGAGESGAGNYSLTGSLDQARSTDRVTIDVNLIDFDSFAMVPKMSAVNSVEIYSGRNSAEIGFSFFANTFGVNGEVKTIQGRHAAVRTLVKYSIVEVVGRYLNLPYWNLLPNGKEDPVVIKNIRKKYMSASEQDRTLMIQNLLYLHGYDLKRDGKPGQQTLQQLRKYLNNQNAGTEAFNFNTFKALYVSVPYESNYRTASVFPTAVPVQMVAKAAPKPVAQTATPAQTASQEVAESPKDLTSFQEIFSDKKITGTGIYTHKNETIARHLATNFAINDVAKKLGSVLQEEKTELNNDQIKLLLTTQAQNIVKGYEKIKDEYNAKTGRAEVQIQLEGSVVAGKLEKLLKK